MSVIAKTITVALCILTLSTYAAAPVYIQKELPLEEQIQNLAQENSLDAALIQKIIWCESKSNNKAIRLNYRGDVLWSKDVGYFQIDDYYWQEFFLKKGLDIYDPQDNLKAGIYLIKKQGTEPWNSSKFCWGK